MTTFCIAFNESYLSTVLMIIRQKLFHRFINGAHTKGKLRILIGMKIEIRIRIRIGKKTMLIQTLLSKSQNIYTYIEQH
jgi:hypothetical protein